MSEPTATEIRLNNLDILRTMNEVNELRKKIEAERDELRSVLKEAADKVRYFFEFDVLHEDTDERLVRCSECSAEVAYPLGHYPILRHGNDCLVARMEMGEGNCE